MFIKRILTLITALFLLFSCIQFADAQRQRIGGGDGQTGIIGQILPEPILYFYFSGPDGSEVGIPNTVIKFDFFEVPTGAKGHALIPKESTTNSRGLAGTRVILGNIPGTYKVKGTVKGTNRNVFFNLTATDSMPSRVPVEITPSIVKIFGDAQEGRSNTELPQIFEIEASIVDDLGNEIFEGIPINFAITEYPKFYTGGEDDDAFDETGERIPKFAGASLDTLNELTDDLGSADSRLTLGSKLGLYRVTTSFEILSPNDPNDSNDDTVLTRAETVFWAKTPLEAFAQYTGDVTQPQNPVELEEFVQPDEPEPRTVRPPTPTISATYLLNSWFFAKELEVSWSSVEGADSYGVQYFNTTDTSDPRSPRGTPSGYYNTGKSTSKTFSGFRAPEVELGNYTVYVYAHNDKGTTELGSLSLSRATKRGDAPDAPKLRNRPFGKRQPVLVILPKRTALLPNYPNPFNPETWMPYELSVGTNVGITIFNAQGQVVRKLQLGYQDAGYYLSRERAVHWDGKNESGERVSSGVYFYMLSTDKHSLLRKMVILK